MQEIEGMYGIKILKNAALGLDVGNVTGAVVLLVQVYTIGLFNSSLCLYSNNNIKKYYEIQ